ncbi:MAG: hypothetical protein IJY14_01665 [Acholeplasmatales bacterium]|nr:hypothetical protein [Acholeplasmatales bacterium]
MARVVRKVSGKAVKGQKRKGLLRNKKFWIASIIALLVIIGTIIGLVIWLNNNDDEATDEVTINEVDYFAKTYDVVDLEDNQIYQVDFEYRNHKGLVNYVNGKEDAIQKSNVIVFAYNMDTFFAEKQGDDDENYVEAYDKLVDQLCSLQRVIDKYNENASDEDKIYLYIVNLNIGTNNEILSDELFVGSENDNKLTVGDTEEFEGPLITSIFDGEFQLKDEIRNKPISSTTVTSNNFSVISNLVKYIQGL